jgi:carboxymethylenebutenolidase
MTNSQPKGFIADPKSGKRQGVLVLHAWWGLTVTIKDFCNRLAGEGFTAFAPDLYHGKLATTIQEAETLRDAFDWKNAIPEISTAAEFLQEHCGEPEKGLAVIGFSMGAFYALNLSTTDPEHVHKVVVFYGTGPADFSKSRAAYQGHFAETDQFEPDSEVTGLEESLRLAGRPISFYRYPETGHWFFEPDRVDAFNPAAAKLAWERTLAFLEES